MADNNDDWVFAYRSNMNLPELKKWFVDKGYPLAEVQAVESVVLPSYELVWNYFSTTRGAGAANVCRRQEVELPGLALRVNQSALQAIDRKEGHPKFYDRGTLRECLKLAEG